MARTLKIVLTGVLALFCFLLLALSVAVSLFDSPEYARRLLVYGQSDTQDYLIFPERVIRNGDTVSILETADLPIPQTVTFRDPYTGEEQTKNLEEVIQRTDTKAFIVVRNDQVIYEGYFNGSTRDSIHTSFSIAKSFNLALIGAAIAEGKIESVDDPVIKYIPEVAGRGLDALTVRDLLMMNSGIRYRHDYELPFFLRPFGDDALTYYSPNLRRIALRIEADSSPIGTSYHYNNYHPLLEGLILERVTGMHVAEYLEEKFWKPMGAQYPASWSLDSETSGFEKMESGINARAVDYVVALHNSVDRIKGCNNPKGLY